MQTYRRITLYFLPFVFFVLLSCTVHTKRSQNHSTASPMGLTVRSDGTLLLHGVPYKAVGVNYFNAFARTLQNESLPDTSYRAGFRYLKARNIPFIRFMGCGFWPRNWDLYQQNPNEYFKRMDAFVHYAEEVGIGLIPSLFWHHSTLPDLVGEWVNQWGNPSSKTIAFMCSYVKQVVSRYRDSPAIWGWEMGNEYNLVADLPGENSHLPQITVENGTPSFRTKNDKLTTTDIRVAFVEFAQSVRQFDASRIIITGNANPRPAAFHLYTDGNWKGDTKEQYVRMLALQNPDPINTFSIHHYPENAFQYFDKKDATLHEVIRVTMEHALKVKKPLFIGEFGAGSTDEKNQQKVREQFMELLDGIEACKVPLAAVWVFDYSPHTTEGGFNIPPDSGSREYMLQAIQMHNQRIK
jgi:hypothetical protein